jgi:hypothetical protein
MLKRGKIVCTADASDFSRFAPLGENLAQARQHEGEINVKPVSRRKLALS